MLDFEYKDSYGVYDLARVVEILRAPGGCPWDAEQTHQSIRRNFIEEACEAAEAIDNGDVDGLKEELGDVLLQVYFHTSIEEDAGRFTLDDVADGVCKKLIYRHPHVFGEVNVRSTEEVLSNWEELKKKEKHQNTQADAVDAVARTLPALWRAEKMNKKAAKAGFYWRDIGSAMEKLSDELGNLEVAALEGDVFPETAGNPVEALGDLLFAAVWVAWHLKVDPEEALHAACDRFARLFRNVEEGAAELGVKLDELSDGEQLTLWNAAKEELA